MISDGYDQVAQQGQTHKPRLLIHHHHHVFRDPDGALWLSSVIGRWVIALAEHFDVDLLFYESMQHQPCQDTRIPPGLITLSSLGPRKRFWQRIFARDGRRTICAAAGGRADYLLIRGVTPHQWFIWRATPAPRKVFLLVGSLHFYSLTLPRSLLDAIVLFVSRLRLWDLRRMVAQGTQMLANSPLLVTEIEQTMGQTAKFVPTNSLCQAEFAPLQVRDVSSPPRLMYCGRLDLQKGLWELFEAVAILNREGLPCQLDMVGGTDTPVYAGLVELATRLGIHDVIHWHGLVPYGPQLFEHYQRADVFVLPSYSEGFPHAIWEAVANCCPVVTTAVGGIPALIEHEEHALLIPPRDVAALVAAIRRALTDATLREKMVTRAHHYAQAYTVEACAQKLASTLYQDV